MKTNMGTFDRVFRTLVAIAIVVLYFSNTISGTLGILLVVLSGIFLLTSLVSFCPIYTLIGMNTCKKKS
jgi:hypothetical protein